MIQTRVQELERIAADYHLKANVPDKFIEDICQDYCCAWLAQFLRADDRVAELGYGEGVTVSHLASISSHYTVVEGAPSLAAEVKRKFPLVTVLQELFEEHVPDKPYDKVLALHVLEHVDDPVSLARHLCSWLAPGGELVVVVPNKASLHRRLAVLMGLAPALDTLSPRDQLVGHQRVYDLAGLLEDLSAAGLEPIEVKGFFLKTLPNGMMLSHSPELIEALNQIGEELPPEMLANIAVRCRVRV